MRGNSVSISGNLTRDVEMRTTQSGRNVASFGIAWNQRRRNPQTGDYEDVPHYFDCECWMSDAQARVVSPKLVRGAHVAIVDGHLAYHSWQAQDGSKRSAVRIVVDDPFNGIVVEPRGQQGGGYQQSQGSQQGYQQGGGYQQQNQGGYQQSSYQPQQSAPVIDASSSVYDEDIPF